MEIEEIIKIIMLVAMLIIGAGFVGYFLVEGDFFSVLKSAIRMGT
jgi:hypothetical protein